MSIQTWLEEFSNEEVDGSLPVLEQIRRERRFMVGLHGDNLKRHDIFQEGAYLREEGKREGFYWIEVAHMCSPFWDEENNRCNCHQCPLYDRKKEKDCAVEYEEAVDGKGPGAMIALLNKAEKEVKGRARK